MSPILGTESTAHDGQPAVCVDFDLKTFLWIKTQTLSQDRGRIHASVNTTHQPSTRKAGHTNQDVLSGSSGGQRPSKFDCARAKAYPSMVTSGNQN